jgi:hypothetical protein
VPADLDTASTCAQNRAPENFDILGRSIMARIFALLILAAAVTGAAAGERFPILQPDQMNTYQKMLLEPERRGVSGATFKLILASLPHKAAEVFARGRSLSTPRFPAQRAIFSKRCEVMTDTQHSIVRLWSNLACARSSSEGIVPRKCHLIGPLLASKGDLRGFVPD